MTHPRTLLLGATTLLLAAGGALAQDARGLSLHGLVDLRAVSASADTSWLEGGLGKLRYGGERGDGRFGIHVAQASLVLRASLSEELYAHVQVNLDPESYERPGLSGVDLIEAFASYRPALSRTVGLRLKAGHFFPPISLEHDGVAWSTTRTLTPSAIDSWVGEEVRVTGLEASLVALLATGDLVFTGAAFGANDPDGSLLAWRGWSLSDRQTGLSDRLPLAPLPEIGPGGSFPKQSPWTAPFREVDGRAGWYAGASWRSAGGAEVRALWFDDGGDRTSVERGQYSWDTTFASAGLRVPLGAFEILGQGMAGRTRMGQGPAIDMTFRAAYALATVRAGPHRFTLRGDLFRTRDEGAADSAEYGDEYGERGWAATAAWLFDAGHGLRVALEAVRVESTRPGRYELGLEEDAVSGLVQASLRLRF